MEFELAYRSYRGDELQFLGNVCGSGFILGEEEEALRIQPSAFDFGDENLSCLLLYPNRRFNTGWEDLLLVQKLTRSFQQKVEGILQKTQLSTERQMCEAVLEKVSQLNRCFKAVATLYDSSYDRGLQLLH